MSRVDTNHLGMPQASRFLSLKMVFSNSLNDDAGDDDDKEEEDEAENNPNTAGVLASSLFT